MNLPALQNEFKKLEMHPQSFSVLQEKDGIAVLRLEYFGKSYVLKFFENPEFRREISLYAVLQTLGVPTVPVVSSTDASLLLEDLTQSPVYRPGEEQDMSDPAVARALARWYKKLHQNGAAYAAAHAGELYDESDYFSRETVAALKEKTGPSPAWALLEENFGRIAHILRETPRTLTYNDFYYTNLAVAKDKSAAFMEEYGPFPPAEEALDAVISPIVTLHMALQRETFPTWGEEALAEVQSGTYCEKIRKLL